MTVTVENPDAHPESNSVDGGAAYSGIGTGGGTWDTAHDSGGTEATITDTHVLSDVMIRAISGITDYYDQWRRALVLFNDPEIPAGDVISAVTVQWINQSVTNQFSGSITFDTSNPASNTTIAAGDYDSFGGVRQTDTDIALSSLSTGNGNLNTLTLNATGRGNTPKDAISKWMWRLVSDFDDSPVTWASSEMDQMRMRTADEAESGDQRPRINITHISTFTPKVIMF